MIYLDHNASTPVDPEVGDALHSCIRTNFGNPSSTYPIGILAKKSVEESRSQVAALIGASEEEILFTSGGTESNNLAIIGRAQQKGKGHIITSAIEHPSVINPCRFLEDRGFTVTIVPADREGKVVVENIKKAIRRETILITVMHANNETGVLQPIEEIAVLAGEAGITLHTDAAQTVGKIPVNIQKLAPDLMTIVSHKFYGPKGIGALYIRKGTDIRPLLFGAGHERGLRPGTENVPGIVGLGKACELAGRYTKERVLHMKKMTSLLYQGLREALPGIRINGHETLRLPNTINVCIPGIDALRLLESIQNQVAASSGSACHSGLSKPSPVLTAMGIADGDALSSIRLSTGKDTREEEIKDAVEIIARAVQSQRR
jgi:cysteine desulfurase